MRRRQVLAVVLVALLQLVVVVTLALAGPDEDTHRAPVRVVAPPVVGASLVERAAALPGRPVEVLTLPSRADAVDSVRSGRSVAAIVVDLRRTTDSVLVAGANGEDLNRALQEQIAAVEASYGRRITVRDVVPARDGDAGHRHVFGFAAVCMLLGLLSAVVITWQRGPRAVTLVRGVLRLLVNALVGVVAGAVLAGAAVQVYDGTGFWRWWLLAALTILAGAMTTQALLSVFGVYGLGVATTVLVLAAAPLVTLVHPLLLPEPWATITPWLPHGAALEAGTSLAYFGGEQVLRPLLVLVAWSVISVITNVASRRELRRESPATG
jgi:hypothetical protein